MQWMAGKEPRCTHPAASTPSYEAPPPRSHLSTHIAVASGAGSRLHWGVCIPSLYILTHVCRYVRISESGIRLSLLINIFRQLGSRLPCMIELRHPYGIHSRDRPHHGIHTVCVRCDSLVSHRPHAFSTRTALNLHTNSSQSQPRRSTV